MIVHHCIAQILWAMNLNTPRILKTRSCDDGHLRHREYRALTNPVIEQCHRSPDAGVFRCHSWR
jgi:hypothetical protein